MQPELTIQTANQPASLTVTNQPTVRDILRALLVDEVSDRADPALIEDVCEFAEPRCRTRKGKADFDLTREEAAVLLDNRHLFDTELTLISQVELEPAYRVRCGIEATATMHELSCSPHGWTVNLAWYEVQSFEPGDGFYERRGRSA